MIITADMILRPARMFTGVCFQCVHRKPKDKVRMCDRNPLGLRIRGDAVQTCGLFELDRRVWVTPRLMVWQHRAHGPQTTMEAFE